MWVEKLKSGKYRFGDAYKDPLTNKFKKVSVVQDKNNNRTRHQAQITLDSIINKRLAESKLNLIKGIRLSELVEQFKQQYKKRVRLSTYINNSRVMSQIVGYFGDDALIENLNRKLLVKFIESLLYDKHYSNSTVSKYKIVLHQLFDFAITQNYLKDNPVDKIKLKLPNNENPNPTRNKFLEESELKAFLKYAYQHNVSYARLCEWLYLTGMRVGEAAALSYNDVTQENNQWSAQVTGTMLYDLDISDQHKSKQPKTSAGFRRVVLPDRAVQIYQDCKQSNPTNSKFIFCTSNGTPIQVSALNSFLRKAKKDLDIDKPMSSHIFRHTHISKLAELGVPLYVIQQRVGHENSNITQRIYLHVTDKAIKKESSKLNLL